MIRRGSNHIQKWYFWNIKNNFATYQFLVIISCSNFVAGGGESKETKSSTEYEDELDIDDCVVTLFRREVTGGGFIKGTLGSPANVYITDTEQL